MSTLTDTGHHNCRDYYVPIQPSTHHTLPPALYKTKSTAQILAFHASQKSPLNVPYTRQTFPFLRLPYELRRKIYSYLLPYTETKTSSGSLIAKATTGSSAASTAHKTHLASLPSAKYAKNTILWHRGQTSILSVSRQLHAECSTILYGENTFVLWISYDQIQFRFRWVLASGLAPSHAYDFLAGWGGAKYIGKIKKMVMTVDCVDEYTGMIKYNVGGSGLTHGLRLQVQKLVRRINTARAEDASEEQGLKILTVRLQNGNDGVLESEKRGIVRSRDSSVRSVEEVQGVLEPLQALTGLREVVICGAVTDTYKQELRNKMMAMTILQG